MLLFLKLYFSHLLADFLPRPNWIAQIESKPSRALVRGGIQFATAMLILNTAITWKILCWIVALALLHAVLDFLKARFTRDEWWAFTLDQMLHVIAIALVSVSLSSAGWSNALSIFCAAANNKRVYLILCAYTGVVLGGGYFVQKVTGYFMRQIDETLIPSKPGLPSAGKYIGWLERSLVITFIITAYYEGIGLLLAAKALVRYPEMKSDEKGHFAEYFLIGTLTSVGIALIAGFIVVGLGPTLGDWPK